MHILWSFVGRLSSQWLHLDKLMSSLKFCFLLFLEQRHIGPKHALACSCSLSGTEVVTV